MTAWLQAMHRILLLTNRLIFEGLGPGVEAAPPSSTVFCPALEPTADEDGDGDGDDDEGEAADEDIAAADFVVAARENLSSKLHAAFAAPPDAPAWDTAAVASSSLTHSATHRPTRNGTFARSAPPGCTSVRGRLIYCCGSCADRTTNPNSAVCCPPS